MVKRQKETTDSNSEGRFNSSYKSGVSSDTKWHPTFEELNMYAANQQDRRLDLTAISSHLEIEKCTFCRTTYTDICGYDPQIRPTDSPIPEKLWQSIWKEFQTDLPYELENIIRQNSKSIIRDLTDIIAREIVAHLADVDYQLSQESKAGIKQTNLETLSAKLVNRATSIANELAADIKVTLELFHKRLLQSLADNFSL